MFDCLTLKRAGLKSKRLSTDFLANNLRFVLYKIYTFQLLRNIIDNFFPRTTFSVIGSLPLPLTSKNYDSLYPNF